MERLTLCEHAIFPMKTLGQGRHLKQRCRNPHKLGGGLPQPGLQGGGETGQGPPEHGGVDGLRASAREVPF